MVLPMSPNSLLTNMFDCTPCLVLHYNLCRCRTSFCHLDMRYMCCWHLMRNCMIPWRTRFGLLRPPPHNIHWPLQNMILTHLYHPQNPSGLPNNNIQPCCCGYIPGRCQKHCSDLLMQHLLYFRYRLVQPTPHNMLYCPLDMLLVHWRLLQCWTLPNP